MVVLENYQALPAPAETYGKDANSILRAIMRVKERPDDIMEKFEQFYHAIDAQESIHWQMRSLETWMKSLGMILILQRCIYNWI